jgi:pimeloyl-ACP methyl ester carboxylesterase
VVERSHEASGCGEEIIRVDLAEVVPKLDLPVYLVHGLFDYTCSFRLAQDYLRELSAPVKGFYRFEHSAHSPLFEEPDLGHKVLQIDVLRGGTSLAAIR